MSEKLNYKNSGVDVKAGENSVNAIKPLVQSTYNKNVLSDLGVFGGFYQIDLEKWEKPILVSSTDGVGTKLLVAQKANVFDTVGQDIVNHCIDDIFVHGAHPQYFLDYIGIGKMATNKITHIISGMTKACKENDMALIGGEMAEMPDVYHGEDFDLVGTIVGMVEKDKIITGEEISEDDVVIGFTSTGLHTNGYSLARKIIFDKLGMAISDIVENTNKTVAELLLAVHKSYYPELKQFADPNIIHGMAHITGGGIIGNLKRVIPDGLAAIIENSLWETPELYNFLQEKGKIDNNDMFEAFNMGIGFMILVPENKVDMILNRTSGIKIGKVIKTDSNKKVRIKF
ncbi:MAG: phosphoribosylformylglycinamidine cyclo-ligase [Candidatus Cloacimonadota bacterium]|nr:phosphoribosylformylglycinamidine cyclo-ligase [Candidatus Cloacimonadota bacterium]